MSWNTENHYLLCLMLRKKNHPEICGIKHSFTMLMKSVGQKFRKGSLGNSCLGVSELGAVRTHWDCSNPNAWPGWGIPLQGGSITLNESWGWPLANNNRFFPCGLSMRPLKCPQAMANGYSRTSDLRDWKEGRSHTPSHLPSFIEHKGQS